MDKTIVKLQEIRKLSFVVAKIVLPCSPYCVEPPPDFRLMKNNIHC